MHLPFHRFWLLIFCFTLLGNSFGSFDKNILPENRGICGIPNAYASAEDFRADAELLSGHLTDLRVAVEVKSGKAPSKLSSRSRHKKAGLFEVLVTLNNEQRRWLATVYCKRHLKVQTLQYPPNTDSVDEQIAFTKDCLDPMFRGKRFRWAIKGLVELKLSPEFENLLRAMLEPPLLYDARQLRRLMTSIHPNPNSNNTVIDLDVLFDLWLNRSEQELATIYALYKMLFDFEFEPNLRMTIEEYQKAPQESIRLAWSRKELGKMMNVKYLNVNELCDANCLQLLFKMARTMEQSGQNPFKDTEQMKALEKWAHQLKTENKVTKGIVARMQNLARMHEKHRKDPVVRREWLDDTVARMLQAMSFRDHEELTRILVSASERNLMDIAIHYRRNFQQNTKGGLRENVKVSRQRFLLRNLLKDKVSNSYLYGVANLLFYPNFMDTDQGDVPEGRWFKYYCIVHRPNCFHKTVDILAEMDHLTKEPSQIKREKETNGFRKKGAKVAPYPPNEPTIKNTDIQTVEKEEYKKLLLMKERFQYIYGKDLGTSSPSQMQRSKSIRVDCKIMERKVSEGQGDQLSDTEKFACFATFYQSLNDQAMKICKGKGNYYDQWQQEEGDPKKELCESVGEILARVGQNRAAAGA